MNYLKETISRIVRETVNKMLLETYNTDLYHFTNLEDMEGILEDNSISKVFALLYPMVSFLGLLWIQARYLHQSGI